MSPPSSFISFTSPSFLPLPGAATYPIAALESALTNRHGKMTDRWADRQAARNPSAPDLYLCPSLTGLIRPLSPFAASYCSIQKLEETNSYSVNSRDLSACLSIKQTGLFNIFCFLFLLLFWGLHNANWEKKGKKKAKLHGLKISPTETSFCPDAPHVQYYGQNEWDLAAFQYYFILLQHFQPLL